MDALGVQEGLARGERVFETLPEVVGVVPGEEQFVAVDGDRDPVAASFRREVRRVGEFLDQPRRRGFWYPLRPESSGPDSAW
ncbi:MAG: hypothetical protein ABEH83_02915 [Halobacterium sp.]